MKSLELTVTEESNSRLALETSEPVTQDLWLYFVAGLMSSEVQRIPELDVNDFEVPPAFLKTYPVLDPEKVSINEDENAVLYGGQVIGSVKPESVDRYVIETPRICDGYDVMPGLKAVFSHAADPREAPVAGYIKRLHIAAKEDEEARSKIDEYGLALKGVNVEPSLNDLFFKVKFLRFDMVSELLKSASGGAYKLKNVNYNQPEAVVSGPGS